MQHMRAASRLAGILAALFAAATSLAQQEPGAPQVGKQVRIVVASVATGGRPDSPTAGTILRSVFWHSVTLAILVGIMVMLQAYVWPGVVPGPR